MSLRLSERIRTWLEALSRMCLHLPPTLQKQWLHLQCTSFSFSTPAWGRRTEESAFSRPEERNQVPLCFLHPGKTTPSHFSFLGLCSALLRFPLIYSIKIYWGVSYEGVRSSAGHMVVNKRRHLDPWPCRTNIGFWRQSQNKELQYLQWSLWLEKYPVLWESFSGSHCTSHDVVFRELWI